MAERWAFLAPFGGFGEKRTRLTFLSIFVHKILAKFGGVKSEGEGFLSLRSYEVPSPPSLSPLCSPGALIFTIRAVLVQFHGAFATVDGRMRAAEEALPLLCMPRVAVDPPCARQ